MARDVRKNNMSMKQGNVSVNLRIFKLHSYSVYDVCGNENAIESDEKYPKSRTDLKCNDFQKVKRQGT